MNKIEAVIFDLDNTLLDRTLTFERFVRGLLVHYFSHLESTEDWFKTIVELDEDGYKDKRVLFDELIALMPWTTHPEPGELMAYYKAEYVRNAALKEHAEEILAHVKTKYRTGLITNGRNEIQYGKIDRLGIRDKLDVILVSEEAGVKKPDARIFEMALNRLGLKPEQCVYIGDHPVNDVEAAAKLGMRTVWVKANQPWREGLQVQPNATVERLSELLKIL